MRSAQSSAGAKQQPETLCSSILDSLFKLTVFSLQTLRMQQKITNAPTARPQTSPITSGDILFVPARALLPSPWSLKVTSPPSP